VNSGIIFEIGTGSKPTYSSTNFHCCGRTDRHNELFKLVLSIFVNVYIVRVLAF